MPTAPTPGSSADRALVAARDNLSGVGSLYDAWSPAWSPDGSQIAFGNGGPNSGIEVARADGSGRHLRVPGPAHYPDWTPDRRLIYTKGVRGPTRIFISDGGTERQLIPDASAPARPSYRDWRPCG